MKTAYKLSLGLFPVLLAATSLGGCNTVAGFGRDLQAAGAALAHAADRVVASDRTQTPVGATDQGAFSGSSQPAQR